MFIYQSFVLKYSHFVLINLFIFIIIIIKIFDNIQVFLLKIKNI